MYTFINSIDRTSDVIRNSIKITDELQERINRATFKLFGDEPTEGQDIKIYDGYKILSSTVNSVTLDKKYNTAIQNDLFRVGAIVYVAINESDEESATILTITDNGDNLKLTMSANFDNTPAVGELCGIKKFAGNLFKPNDRNISLLKNIEYNITAYDYTKIFDKALLNDTYEDRDARYMINDFCNVTINKNQVIDQFDYANVTELRAEWTEGDDGDNPTFSDTDYKEGTASGAFPWTNSSGTATFEYTFASSINLIEFTGVASGTPIKGVLGNWIKTASGSVITSINVRIGSDSSNYADITITEDSDWKFDDAKLKDAAITGTPDWTAVDYLKIIIVQTGDGSISWDGIRILEEEFFRHYPYVEDSVDFDDFRMNRIKPTEIMQRMSEELGWYWYIDYDRNIRMFANTTNNAPFNISEDSNNFTGLSITHDISRLANRVVVQGGDETSENKYSQVIEGDSVKREWIMKNKFKNLEVELDDGSVTDSAEAGTTTTTIIATGHGLLVDDYIVNRTRSNAVRKVLTVADVNTFTVDLVTSQASGDSFSTFVAQDVGIEGISSEVGNNYMSNFNEKSIRTSEEEDVLNAGDFLMFRYNEVFPILVRRSENVSISNMRSVLGYSDGIFDGQTIIDRTLKTRPEAVKIAGAFLNKYSNVIITAKFSTSHEGLKAGQLITIKDTTSGTRNINQTFLIQKIVQKQTEEGENIFAATCSSMLFGMMELLQQLLKGNRKLEVDENAIVNNIEDANETVKITDVVTSKVDDNKQSESIGISDSATSVVFEPPFKWEPTPLSNTRWNLFSW